MTSALLPDVSVIRDPDLLDSLWPEWDALLADSIAPTPFLTQAWLRAWWDTLGRAFEPMVATAIDPASGELVGIAPLAIESRRTIIRHRALVFMGQGPAKPDRLDLMVRRGYEDTAAPLLWRAVLAAAKPDLIDLDGARDVSLIQALALRRSDDRSLAEPTSAPTLDLPADWETYEASLGKNLRQNLRRYARKMDREMAAPVIERMVTDRAEVAPTMDGLGRLHQAIRTARGDRGSFAGPAMREFHLAAALRLHDAGRLRLHRLDIGGTAAAVIYCFRHADTVAFYSTGYDAAYERYGP
ncbi:GNAT family N-acetyltransferase, partial [bacterium]|nr:GNAT family N-acetyltransferase [bacterium]